MEKIAFEILKKLESNCKPTSLLLMGTQLLFRDDRFKEIVEHFENVIMKSDSLSEQYLGKDYAEIILIIKNQ